MGCGSLGVGAEEGWLEQAAVQMYGIMQGAV